MRVTKSGLGAAFGSIALIATFTLAGGGAANAASTSDDTDANYSCWIDLSTNESLCVGEGVDLIAAVAEEAGVQISVPDDMPVGGFTASRARAASTFAVANTAATKTVISAIYDDINYGGGTLVMTVNSGTGCGYGFSNINSLGWGDRASSFRSYGGCETALFKNTGYTGTKIGYSGNKSSLGSMNDQASSWSVQ
jgi:hypothetical protein